MATPAPLFDPTTFRPEQLAMLNNVPGQSLGATNTPEQLLAAQGLTPNIDPTKLTPTVPLVNGNPPAGPNMADSLVADAAAGVKSYNDYLALLQQGQETDTAAEAEGLRDETAGLLEQNVGRGAAQLKAERELGLPGLNKEMADLNAQILSRTAAYNKLTTDIAGKPITMESIIGGQAQVRKAAAAEIGMLQAVALGKQGQIAAAQSTADRAVDLKYDDIESQINMRLQQLKLLEPRLDAEEKRRSQALELYLNDQKELNDEKKASDKQFQNLKITALSNGMSVAQAQQAEQLFNQGQEDAAYALMSGFTGRKSSGPSGVFTRTQLNKGAATAKIPLADFEQLDEDTQNFFINNASTMTKWYSFIDDEAELESDVGELEAKVEGYDVPDAAKDTMRRYLREKFADQYAAMGAPEEEEESGPSFGERVESWWNWLTG